MSKPSRPKKWKKKRKLPKKEPSRHTSCSLQHQQNNQPNQGLAGEEVVKSQAGNGALLGCVCFLISFINEIYSDATKLWYSITSVMQTKCAAPEIFLVALPNAL